MGLCPLLEDLKAQPTLAPFAKPMGADEWALYLIKSGVNWLLSIICGLDWIFSTKCICLCVCWAFLFCGRRKLDCTGKHLI